MAVLPAWWIRKTSCPGLEVSVLCRTKIFVHSQGRPQHTSKQDCQSSQDWTTRHLLGLSIAWASMFQPVLEYTLLLLFLCQQGGQKWQPYNDESEEMGVIIDILLDDNSITVLVAKSRTSSNNWLAAMTATTNFSPGDTSITLRSCPCSSRRRWLVVVSWDSKPNKPPPPCYKCGGEHDSKDVTSSELTKYSRRRTPHQDLNLRPSATSVVNMSTKPIMLATSI